MTGSPNAEAVAWMRRMHDLARQFLPPPNDVTVQTPAYLDLIFAFGHASLNAADPCCQLLAAAHDALSPLDEAHRFLFRAYDYRIRQMLDGRPHAGTLPGDQMEHLEHMERLLRYMVDQLRKHSRILEPDQGINPYRWGSLISDLGRELAELQDMTDCHEAAARIDRLLGEVPNNAKGTEQRAQVVRAGLEAAPRVGEEFGRKMLKEALAVCAVIEQMEPREVNTLLARAITLAHRLGDLEVWSTLVDHSLEVLGRRYLDQQIPWWRILDLISACIEGLIAANRPEDLDVLLYETSSDVLNGRTVDQLAPEREDDMDRLRVLLVLTRAWFDLDWYSLAWPVLNVAFDWLRRSSLNPRELFRLACATARALSVAPADAALPRLEDVLRVLPSSRDTYTTRSHFAISTLGIAESVVLAAVKVWTRDGPPSPSPNPVTH